MQRKDTKELQAGWMAQRKPRETKETRRPEKGEEREKDPGFALDGIARVERARGDGLFSVFLLGGAIGLPPSAARFHCVRTYCMSPWAILMAELMATALAELGKRRKRTFKSGAKKRELASPLLMIWLFLPKRRRKLRRNTYRAKAPHSFGDILAHVLRRTWRNGVQMGSRTHSARAKEGTEVSLAIAPSMFSPAHVSYCHGPIAVRFGPCCPKLTGDPPAYVRLITDKLRFRVSRVILQFQ